MVFIGLAGQPFKVGWNCKGSLNPVTGVATEILVRFVRLKGNIRVVFMQCKTV